ncbi:MULTISPECIES: aminotransferase class I/II-fold pyridoxal phosphate-dependent enzyme [Agrobacterium tumefaciens complex]|jgi:8-amino-7-oxononanoate synthase|uniref:aminotransferase class I/II-fold pyridoxal phosphate-dependent enzyme n=1 Tax=Agrobacterium tumefaciens TaxID=358 RepID=UPI000FE2889D|nr:aminotransferase class I/II-fold pyridoxal phosphate-dependent enzyme [Agrobacterium tumefaciens]QAB01050.1 7-keto-8-aminopelargonate synthetase [Agrobacterium tumefaciens]
MFASTEQHTQSLDSNSPTQARSRNTARMAALSGPSFDRAYSNGLMGVSCTVLQDRRIRTGQDQHVVVDYTRCGYLDLDSHPAVLAAAKSVLDEIPSLHFSVARTRLTAEPLRELEHRLARLFGAESIIVFPTVAAANMGALPLLAAGLFTGGQKPLIAVDRFAHVTLQYHIPVLREDTEVVVIEHNDLQHLADLCSSGRSVAYVGDGAYSMGGAAPVRELRLLQDRYDLFVYLDDAHGISVAGANGEGFVRSQLDSLGDRTIVAASLGKGFGASGGLLMLGTPEQDRVIRRYAPTFGFSCAPNMPAVGAALASAIIHGTPELGRLQKALADNLQLFDQLIPTETRGSPLPIRIVRIGAEEDAIDAAEFLLQRGHYVSAVFFPTVPRGKAALRMAVTAGHQSDDLRDLASALAHWKAAGHQPADGDIQPADTDAPTDLVTSL